LTTVTIAARFARLLHVDDVAATVFLATVSVKDEPDYLIWAEHMAIVLRHLRSPRLSLVGRHLVADRATPSPRPLL
jgi:hypothetical protein